MIKQITKELPKLEIISQLGSLKLIPLISTKNVALFNSIATFFPYI